MPGDPKSVYVSRKVDAFRKDYQRQHERERTPIDQDEFHHRTLDVKYEAEDWWDFWHGEGDWSW